MAGPHAFLHKVFAFIYNPQLPHSKATLDLLIPLPTKKLWLPLE